ncbi:deoxycytidylate deaminase-like [Saccostrea echinata]|uniref:deoxycytidylate deaminase-like n=1 Tax=Saccostrea echinata TaxID=191078 RepID=UPI002A828606|nr:deoxycytidylate deaminase-like [Saccostrea echinata]
MPPKKDKARKRKTKDSNDTNRAGPSDLADKEDSKQSQEEQQPIITWDEYFMGIAFLSARRSKDPDRKVGACIVNKRNRIVSAGYNGFPDASAKADEHFPWTKKEKHDYVCHAELNAIVNRHATSLEDCTLYVTLFPCNECAKLLIQSGIKKVIYFSDDKADRDAFKASRALLTFANVVVIHYKNLQRRVGVPLLTEIKLEFTPPQDD